MPLGQVLTHIMSLRSNYILELRERMSRQSQLKIFQSSASVRGNILPIPQEVLDQRFNPTRIIDYYFEHI